MALDATHLYWVVDGTFGKQGEVWRADRATGSVQQLAVTSERVYALALDATRVYFVHTPSALSTTGGEVLSVSKSGGPTQTLVSGIWNPTSVAVDDAYVYFTVAGSPKGKVQRAPKSGGPAEVILADVDNPWDIAVDTTHVYVSEMNRGRVLRVPKGGGAAQILASGWVGTGWLALDASQVFFSACDSGPCQPSTLYSVSKSGGAPSVLLQLADNNATKLAPSSGFAQWGTWHVPLDATAPKHLIEDSPTDTVVAVAADSKDIYLASFHTGAIYRSPTH